MKLRKLLIVIFYLCQITGFIFTFYGVLRESFADIAIKRGFGEGRFGEGTFGGGPTDTESLAIKIGARLGLLPRDQTLTITDRKQNATFSIIGVILLSISIALDIAIRALF
jgi:hypothetical protein